MMGVLGALLLIRPGRERGSHWSERRERETYGNKARVKWRADTPSCAVGVAAELLEPESLESPESPESPEGPPRGELLGVLHEVETRGQWRRQFAPVALTVSAVEA
ncbi:hypothetical protein B0H10DRAFT_1945752 [Mycena sp. CBHHK59/15]|nr:hypothetical protein B0H10DRAFT_1945752 [Mycena sp. CBHHK59/15]